jgi:hypothetical protein
MLANLVWDPALVRHDNLLGWTDKARTVRSTCRIVGL